MGEIVFNKSIVPIIEARQQIFTKSEKKIAQYFIYECQSGDDLASRAVSLRLGVSDAALTRFAQKCGYRGYRAFAYAYQPNIPAAEDNRHVQPVLAAYQEILDKTYSIVDLKVIQRISTLMQRQHRLYFYGKGSSGMVAREMKFRLMRIGIVCEAITDDDIILMNHVTLDKDSLVIGISISGKTKIIIDALKAAKQKKAKTILFTSNHDVAFREYCDEIQLFAIKNQLEYGRIISPQFPALVVFDILYAHIIEQDKKRRDELWQQTYKALKA